MAGKGIWHGQLVKGAGSELRAAQDSCGHVVNEMSSPGGAVPQPGSHLLQPLGQADASSSAGLFDLPPASPTNANTYIVSKQETIYGNNM